MDWGPRDSAHRAEGVEEPPEVERLLVVRSFHRRVDGLLEALGELGPVLIVGQRRVKGHALGLRAWEGGRKILDQARPGRARCVTSWLQAPERVSVS